MSSLHVTDLVVRYGSGSRATVAVDGASLELAPGRVLGLVGESGSGKTTVAAAVLGSVASTRGAVSVGGAPVTGLRARRGGARPRVQMVFQDPFGSLDPRMTVAESIAEGADADRAGGSGSPRRRAHRAGRAEVTHWLLAVGLDAELADARPDQLSGGECQRVAIARALAARPELLIADEITSALDVSVQGAILNLVRQRQREHGFTMLVISHNLAVVRFLADDVAVMYAGRVVEQGPVDDVIRAPAHPYTRALVAAVPTLDGTGHAAADSTPEADTLDAHPVGIGCRYRGRCENGPLFLPDRERCADEDPQSGASARRHRAECFFPLAES